MNRNVLLALILVLIGAGMFYAGYKEGLFGGPSRYVEESPGSDLFALKVRGTMLDGGTFDSDQYRGKVLLVNIFATWCPPCRKETPELVSMYREFRGRGLAMVMVTQESADEARPFAETYRIPYPMIVGDKSIVAAIPGFQGYPTTILLDRSGAVRYQIVGADVIRIRQSVLRLLDEPAPADRPAEAAGG